MTWVLLRCLAKAVVRRLVPGGDVLSDFAEDAMREWREAKREEQRRQEMEELVALTAEKTRRIVEEIVAQVAADHPEATRRALADYLARVPGSIRSSLSRPEDPSGTSLPPGMELNDGNDLEAFLPAAPSLAREEDDDEYADVVFDEPAPAASKRPASLLQPMTGGDCREWPLTRPYYSVGRSGAKIDLGDAHVSHRHLAVVRLGDVWVVVNRAKDKRLRVGGWEVRQRTLHDGDVLRVGRSWLAFRSAQPAEPPSPMRLWASGRLGVRSGFAAPPATTATRVGTLSSLGEDEDEPVQCVLLRDGQAMATSAGTPLLIGSHPACAVRLTNAGVARLHAILSWTPEGLRLFDLDSGIGTTADGQPVREATLRDGQTIGVGTETLTVRIHGDPTAPARSFLIRAGRVPRGIALTVIYGPHCGESVLLPDGESVSLGRDEDADLAMPRETRIASRQAELRLDLTAEDGPCVRVSELTGGPATLINRQEFDDSGEVRPGDVIQFGNPKQVAPTALMVHYPLSLESWTSD